MADEKFRDTILRHAERRGARRAVLVILGAALVAFVWEKGGTIVGFVVRLFG